jgi:hypothetical protein
MVFLAQFKVTACRDRLAVMRILLAERGVYFRSCHERGCKRKKVFRFIPARLGELQSFEAIDITRRSLDELKLHFQEKLVLVVPQGTEVRSKLEERLTIEDSYACPHIDPNHPGFQVFEVDDVFLAERLVEEITP